MTTIIKGTTKRGKNLIARGNKNEGYCLRDVYNNYSYEKEKAYNDCFEKYFNTPNSKAFGICSFNTFSFSVSWLGDYVLPNGETEQAMFIETSNNSYVILLNK